MSKHERLRHPAETLSPAPGHYNGSALPPEKPGSRCTTMSLNKSQRARSACRSPLVLSSNKIARKWLFSQANYKREPVMRGSRLKRSQRCWREKIRPPRDGVYYAHLVFLLAATCSVLCLSSPAATIYARLSS